MISISFVFVTNKEMKSSLGKLRKIAMNNKSETKDNWDLNISDGLTQAAKDMKDMRACYDGFLSAAAATANSAFEFSESLLEMGGCLLEKNTIDDGECGRTLSLLGKKQLELRELVDIYRSHIIMTITNPSESLLSELRKVEEMKLQCDEKREMFEYMVGQLKEKGKSRHSKGDTFTSQQVHAVREEYDEAARLCVFRVQSLKQGQCQSLLTQAARHHTAQINFFRKGLQSLEDVESRVRNVAETHHIDYELGELHDGELVDDEGDSFDTNDDKGLNVDYYRQSKLELNNASVSRNSMEVDQVVAPNPQKSRMKDLDTQINSGKNQRELMLSQQNRAVSHSAPINSEKFDPGEKIREMQTTVWKLNTHVLPTPADAKGSRTNTCTPPTSTTLPNKSSKSMWHSSPLDTEKHKKFLDDPMSAHSTSKPLVAVEENIDKHFLPLPRPLNEVAAVTQFDSHSGIDAQKIKRQAFSGPLAGKPSSNKLPLFTSGPTGSTEQPQSISGKLSHVTGGPPPSPSSLNVPHSAAHPLLSSPKISELHELPRPPDSSASNHVRSAVALGHSAPLVNRNREVSPTYRSPFKSSKEGSPLPLPRLNISRSFSIRTSSQPAISLHTGKGVQSSQTKQYMEEPASPSLTPIALLNMKSPNSGKIRGGY